MYSISVSYSPIHASLLPGAQSSPYGSHFLIRLVDGWIASLFESLVATNIGFVLGLYFGIVMRTQAAP
jgi:hypothetical protein